MVFNCLKATEPLRGDSLLFTIQFQGGAGTHLIDLGRMKGYSHPVALNLGLLDWESSTSTTRPLLHWYWFTYLRHTNSSINGKKKMSNTVGMLRKIIRESSVEELLDKSLHFCLKWNPRMIFSMFSIFIIQHLQK